MLLWLFLQIFRLYQLFVFSVAISVVLGRNSPPYTTQRLFQQLASFFLPPLTTQQPKHRLKTCQSTSLKCSLTSHCCFVAARGFFLYFWKTYLMDQGLLPGSAHFFLHPSCLFASFWAHVRRALPYHVAFLLCSCPHQSACHCPPFLLRSMGACSLKQALSDSSLSPNLSLYRELIIP